MKKVLIIVSLGLMILSNKGLCQKDLTKHFVGPILTDSLSTVFLPIQYNKALVSSSKMEWWNYYANIVVYDYKSDRYRNLFERDTYIETFKKINDDRYSPKIDNRLKNITGNWVFMLVKNKDYNTNGKIDENDPSILFVVSTKGENLKPLTDETENVVSFVMYEAQGFGLIQIQRDLDKDKSFKNEDKDFYFKRIDLGDLSLGKGIEVK